MRFITLEAEIKNIKIARKALKFYKEWYPNAWIEHRHFSYAIRAYIKADLEIK